MNCAPDRSWPYGEIPPEEPVRLPAPPRRRKSLRHRFCDGIEAAVKGEPGAVAGTKPRTVLGLIVRNLVGRAAEGRCDAVRLVVFFLDEGERRRLAMETRVAGDSQGNSAAQPPPEPRWDWSEDGEWDASGRGPDAADREEAEAEEAKTEALRAELREKFLRVAEADRINAERKARLEAERQGRNAVTGPEAMQVSGNYAAD
jgi:hypothetical protein